MSINLFWVRKTQEGYAQNFFVMNVKCKKIGALPSLGFFFIVVHMIYSGNGRISNQDCFGKHAHCFHFEDVIALLPCRLDLPSTEWCELKRKVKIQLLFRCFNFCIDSYFNPNISTTIP